MWDWGVYLDGNSVVSDTCLSLQEYLQNPINTTLNTVLPCAALAAANATYRETRIDIDGVIRTVHSLNPKNHHFPTYWSFLSPSLIWPLTLPQKLFVPHTYEQKFQQDRWHFYDVGILQQNKTFMAYAQGITSLTGLCDPIGPAPDYSYTGICPNNTLPLGDLQEVSNRPPDKHIAFCNLCSQKLTLQNKHPMKICWIHGNLDLTSVLNMLHRQITACW